MDDYPIRVTRQEPNATFSAPRFSQHRYRAYIVNASITGSGNTPIEAMVGLRQNFESVTRRRKEEHYPRRPGANWPVEFASQEKISADESLSEYFIEKVLWFGLGMDFRRLSLWDFHTEQQTTCCSRRFARSMASTFQISNRRGYGKSLSALSIPKPLSTITPHKSACRKGPPLGDGQKRPR